MSTDRYVDVQRTLSNIENSPIHPENGQAIRDFVNHMAAEGISEVQQQRLAWSWKTLLLKFAPEDFRIRGATEAELKEAMANVNRSDYAEATKIKFKTAVKKFYRIENGGHEQPEKTRFFKIGKEKSSVNREDLFTEDELKSLFRGFSSTRDRAITMVMYESAARPGEVLALNIADFSANDNGDFVDLNGLKNTPDRTNQLIRAGRPVREWLAQHPLGGDMGDIKEPSAPLWVKSEQQECVHCGDIPRRHDDGSCDYQPDLADRVNYSAYLRRFKRACEKAEIPENKRRPYNLRHTRLTEVATFMGYEQLNKFAGWKPGSDRAKVYVHLNSEDVNKAIREEYGLEHESDKDLDPECPYCGAINQQSQTECRRCGRPISIEMAVSGEEKQSVLERLKDLEDRGVLDKLDELDP